MVSKEIDKLIELLGKYKDIYSKEEIINAVTSEGYSQKIAKEVVNILYSKKNNPKEITKEPEKMTIKEEVEDSAANLDAISEKKEENDFSEVDNLIMKMKEQVPKTTEVEVAKEQQKPDNIETKPVVPEIGKTVQPTTNIPAITEKKPENTQNNKDKDITQVPRRLRRFYRDTNKPEEASSSVQNTTDDGSRHYRERLKSIESEKSNSSGTVQDNIVDVIYTQVKDKTELNKPREEIERLTKEEVGRFRDRHNREPDKREEINQVVDNIFAQLARDEEVKKMMAPKDEEKPAEEKIKKENTEEKTTTPTSAGFDLNLDLSNFGGKGKINNADLQDLDLNLNLDLPTEKKKVEKK